MAQDFLSDVELYFTDQPVSNNKILITGEESHHLINVMRHKAGDTVFITDGNGNIYKSEITLTSKKNTTCLITETIRHTNNLSNIWFCIPRLKNPARFEYALEKCTELGITNFIIFDSDRTVAKGEKIARWEKILLAAMKQSLRAFRPNISYEKSVKHVCRRTGVKIFFDQNADTNLNSFLPALKLAGRQPGSQLSDINYLFIFGPEGGLSEEELMSEPGDYKIKLTDNRLRSETAIVSAASILCQMKL